MGLLIFEADFRDEIKKELGKSLNVAVGLFALLGVMIGPWVAIYVIQRNFAHEKVILPPIV